MKIKKSITFILIVVFMGISLMPLSASAGEGHRYTSHKAKILQKHAHRHAKLKIQKRRVRRHVPQDIRRHIRKHHTDSRPSK